MILNVLVFQNVSVLFLPARPGGMFASPPYKDRQANCQGYTFLLKMHGSEPQSSGGWSRLTANMLICSRKMSGGLIETRDAVAYSMQHARVCVRV